MKGVDLGMGGDRSFQAEKTQALGWEEPWHIQKRPCRLQGRTPEENGPHEAREVGQAQIMPSHQLC